jgi:hypothetical protein
MRTRNILICFRISEHWDHVLGRFCQVSFKPYAFRQHSLIRRRSTLGHPPIRQWRGTSPGRSNAAEQKRSCRDVGISFTESYTDA